MIVKPQVNLNGTGGPELFRQWRDSYQAVDAAINALSAGFPHGRDYQTMEQSAYRQARVEHDKRLAALQVIKLELREITYNVYDQLSEKEQREASK